MLITKQNFSLSFSFSFWTNVNKNKFLGGIRIPKIVDQAGNIIHLEDNQSEDTFRPTFICPGKEDQDLVQLIVEKMDNEAKEIPTIAKYTFK